MKDFKKNPLISKYEPPSLSHLVTSSLWKNYLKQKWKEVDKQEKYKI